MFLAVLSVPVLLLGKPIYLYWLRNGSHHLGTYRVRISDACLKEIVEKCGSITIFFPLCKFVNTLSLSVQFQGYERVRRSSDEDESLMRAHDMEEGSSYSDLSTSGDHHPEVVSIENSLIPINLMLPHKHSLLFFLLVPVYRFFFNICLCNSLILQRSYFISPFTP